MRDRIVCLLITILFSLSSVSSYAELYNIENQAKLLENDIFLFDPIKKAITQCNISAEGKIIVPSEIDGVKVAVIAENAFSGCVGITDIILQDGIDTIKSGAFADCALLEHIKLPSSLKVVENNAFKNCTALEGILIPKASVSLSSSAFDGCNKLIIYVSDGTNASVKSGSKTLSGEVSIQSEIDGIKVTKIGDAAFQECNDISSVVIPESVISIGNNAFSSCDNMKKIIFPDGLQNLGRQAFYACSSLEEISIPESVTLIDTDAFIRCTSLERFNVAEENKIYSGIDGVLFNKAGDKLIQYPNKKMTEYIIPESTKIINNNAFSYCNNLTDVTIPENLTEICDGAFQQCEDLVSVVILSTSVKIGKKSFSGCESLTIYCQKDSSAAEYADTNNIEYSFVIPQITPTYTVPENITAILGQTLAEVRLPVGFSFESSLDETLEKLGKKKLKVTYTPADTVQYKTVTGIDITITVFASDSLLDGEFHVSKGNLSWRYRDGTLYIACSGNMPDYDICETDWYMGKDQIKHIVFENNETNSIGAYAFYGLEYLEDIELPENIDMIGINAFNGCKNLTAVNLPQNMKGGIGEGAFGGCRTLVKMIVPDNVIAIGSEAFRGCNNLKSITLPFIGSANGTTNNANTFEYIFGKIPTSLTEVTITRETSIPEDAFKDCAKIRNITIKSDISSIGSSAFNGCSSLEEFHISDKVTLIPDEAFKNCISMKYLNIPENVREIGESAFENCGKIKNLNIPDGIESIEDNTFKGCSSLEMLDIPDTVKFIGENILAEASSLYALKVPFIGTSAKPDIDKVTYGGVLGYFFGISDEGTLQGDNIYAVPPSLTKVEVSNIGDNSYIPPSAFENCSNIVDIIINNGKIISKNAFKNCRSLKNIYLPASANVIEENILENCIKLNTLVVPFVGHDRNINYSEDSVLGYFFGKSDIAESGSDVLQYYDKKNSCYYHIPDTLKNVTITNQTNIPYGAFMSCNNIEKIYIITGAKIYDRAFKGCSNLKKVLLPADMNEIGVEAFEGCVRLEEINIPVSAEKIGENAFYNASGLKKVIIPDSVTSIENDVFRGVGSRFTIVCSEGSAAKKYADENSIKTEVVDKDKLYVKNTCSTSEFLTGGTLMLDITNTYNLSGVMIVGLYNSEGALIAVKTETASGIEHRISFTAEQNGEAEYARIFIFDGLNTIIPQTSEAENIDLQNKSL